MSMSEQLTGVMKGLVAEVKKMGQRISAVLPHLNEQQKRIYLGGEALAFGRGGQTIVAEVSGASRATIRRGMLKSRPNTPSRGWSHSRKRSWTSFCNEGASAIAGTG